MIKIAISEAAFAAISSTLALGSVGYENQTNERGERLVWLPPNVVDRLRASAGRARATATSFCDSSGWRARAPHSSAGPGVLWSATSALRTRPTRRASA